MGGRDVVVATTDKIAQAGFDVSIPTDWDDVVFLVATVVVALIIAVLSERLESRRAQKAGGKWPTTKLHRTLNGLWYWTCWYCNEASQRFPTREAARSSASLHTDHVER